MAKKSWWINLLKNLFTCDSQTKPQKVKRKGWGWFFNKFKLKQLPSTIEQRSLSEAKEEQRKHALNVAKATAAAAEAAMAAAQAAAEVVRLTGVSRSCVRLPHKEAWNLAATKIQTAFRAYLARKALRALKGVVRIQALARGRAVRRQVNKLKNSRSSHRSRLIYSHNAHRKNCSESREIGEKYQSPRISSELVERSKLESKSQRQWTGSLFSKEELKSLYMKRHEAAFRRERMRQYSFSNRESRSCQMLEETVPLRDHLSHTWISKKWAKEKTALDFRCNTRMSDLGGTLRIKPRNLFEDFSEQVTSSPSSYPRRSFCDVRQKPSFDDDECQLTNSFISYPTYMASTESAKAKMRSFSTPRQRVGYADACFEQESPYICSSNKPFQWSSSNGDSKTSSAQAILFS